MKVLCWFGTGDARVEVVTDPKILDPRDAIVKITSTAICGSDLHLYDSYMPMMEKATFSVTKNMGEVVETGINVGNKVAITFTISCGICFFCQKELWSLCDRSNPSAKVAGKEFKSYS